MSPIFLLLLPFLSADWRFVSFTPLELSVYPASEVRLCGDAGTSKATLANARRKRREASFVPLEDEEEREKSEATEAKSFGRRNERLKKKKKKLDAHKRQVSLTTPSTFLQTRYGSSSTSRALPLAQAPPVRYRACSVGAS